MSSMAALFYTGRLVEVAADHYWVDLTDENDASKGYSVTFICAADDSKTETLGENLSLETAQELRERHLARANVKAKA
jgi:hypothetical protein